MPIGVIINALAVVIGGLVGGFLSKRGTVKPKNTVMLILGVCALSMGITAVIKMVHLPAVILSIIIGTIIGEVIELDKRIISFFRKMLNKLGNKKTDKAYMEKLLVMTVLACASGTGIYGALLSGMTGDHSLLITKAILDVFTATIFALSLSYIVALLGIFQFVILGIIFLSAKLIMPLVSDIMILDFIACGGIIMLATGLKVANIKDINIANMIPSMFLVMPLSYLASLILI